MNSVSATEQTETKPLKIAVACGGTGGHVMPGMATAMVLRNRGHHVTLWLTGKEVEDRSASEWNGPVIRVAARGFPNGFSLKGLSAAWQLRRSAQECRTVIEQEGCDVLLAMGSYASAGPVLAARKLKIPYVLHEANVLPGRAVKLFARRAAAVACHFEGTFFYLSKRNLHITGMPLRKTLYAEDQPALELPEQDRFTLLIMGGSAGAHVLNEVGTEAVAALAARGRAPQVIHLTGAADEEWVRERYEEARVSAWVQPFSAAMAPLYRAADVAICRAGASTCAELSLFSLPALLVPYPHAANDHQTANARALERQGAVDVVPEYDLNAAWLADYIEASMNSTKRLEKMRRALQQVTPADGAERLADVVEQCGRPK